MDKSTIVVGIVTRDRHKRVDNEVVKTFSLKNDIKLSKFSHIDGQRP